MLTREQESVTSASWWTNGRTDGQTDRRTTDGWADGRTDGRTGSRESGGLTDGSTYERKDGQTNRWTDGQACDRL